MGLRCGGLRQRLGEEPLLCKLFQVGTPGFDWKDDRTGGLPSIFQEGGRSRADGPALIRLTFLAAPVEVGGGTKVAVVYTCYAILRQVRLSRHDVDANLVGLKNGSKPVVVDMADGVVFVIVTLGTVQGQSHEGLARVFNRAVKPGGAIEFEPAPGEKAGGCEYFRIVRRDFIAREHFADHLVVAFVLVE